MLTMSFTGNAAQAEQRLRRVAQPLPPGERHRLPGAVGCDPPAAGARARVISGRRPLDAAADAAARAAPVHHKAGVAHKPQISPGPPCCRRDERADRRQPAARRARRAPTRYNSQPLLTANDDGTGESVALVEFSNYAQRRPARRTRRASPCTSRSPGSSVNGGNDHRRPAATRSRSTRRCSRARRPASTTSGRSSRPQSTRWPACSTRSTPTTSTEGVHIVSDSWGNCEAALLEARPGGDQPRAAADGGGGHVVLRRVGRRRLVRLRIAVSASTASRSTTRPCSRTPPASAAPTSTQLRARPRRSGAATARERRRRRRRVALVHEAVVAEGPRRDPHRPVEQDEVRRQDALLPRGARRRVRRRSRPPGYVINCTTAAALRLAGRSSAARRRRRRSWPPSRPTRTSSASRTAACGWASQIRSSTTSSRSIRRCSTTSPSGNNSILGGSLRPTAPAPATTWRAGLGSVDVNSMATDLANYTRSAVKVHGTQDHRHGASVNPVTAGACHDPVGHADRHHVPHAARRPGRRGSRGSSAATRHPVVHPPAHRPQGRLGARS